MKIEHIESSSTFAVISGILKNDIKVLGTAFLKENADPKIKNLVDSLIYAKGKIIDMIPNVTNMNNEEYAGPPRQSQFAGYKLENLSNLIDQVKVIEMLIDTETMESEFVNSAYTEKGIPSDLKSKLNNIIGAYQKIVSQLERSKSTQQLGTIVI